MDIEQSLTAVYGSEPGDQLRRYDDARAAFCERYGDGPVDVFRAPGRVNVIGEHTDYNHGYVLPAALDKDILLLTRPRPDREIRLTSLEEEFAPSSFVIEEEIPSAPPGHWSNYARGAAQMLAQVLDEPPSGFDALVVGAAPAGIPRGAGLSSSSALTVVMAVALAHYANWSPPAAELAHFCSDAEWYVGTRGGIMDQFIALLGRRDHALFLDCRPDEQHGYRTEHVPLPQTHRLVVVDSGVKHSNVRGAYNQRVAACRAGVQLLRAQHPGITHLRDVEKFEWETLGPLLPDEITVGELLDQQIDLGEIPGLTPQTELRVTACCRHVWSENRRVLAALDAMHDNDIAALGGLMNEAHASARDDYAISCPELEILVKASNEVNGVAGTRLTGAGWGGCVVALVDADAVDEYQRHVAAEYRKATDTTPSIFLCRAGPGAGHLFTIG